jgi:hypothetical protein
MRPTAVFVVLMIAAAGSDARAQDGRLFGPPAIEAVAAIATGSDAPGDPSLYLDFASTVPIGSRFGAIVRPYAHRLSGGEWEAEMYQLQLRYQSRTRIPVRIDAGIITSPLGLASLEMRQDLSPAIKSPFYYNRSLPRFEAQDYDVQLISGGYPLGATVSVSGTKWDARAGFTDSSPAKPRNAFGTDRPNVMRQLVAGGGISPITGLRLGAGLAHGAYRSSDTSVIEGTIEVPGADVTVVNLEGEYAFGHTRLSGEWVRSEFESTPSPAVARGYYFQAVHTFSPRLFGTLRLVGASTPAFVSGVRVRRSMTTAELSAGYRLTHDLAVRAGYYSPRRYGATSRSHTAVVSLVWARRWF